MVVGVGFGKSGSKGFGLHVKGDLSWGLLGESGSSGLHISVSKFRFGSSKLRLRAIKTKNKQKPQKNILCGCQLLKR